MQEAVPPKIVIICFPYSIIFFVITFCSSQSLSLYDGGYNLSSLVCCLSDVLGSRDGGGEGVEDVEFGRGTDDLDSGKGGGKGVEGANVGRRVGGRDPSLFCFFLVPMETAEM